MITFVQMMDDFEKYVRDGQNGFDEYFEDDYPEIYTVDDEGECTYELKDFDELDKILPNNIKNDILKKFQDAVQFSLHQQELENGRAGKIVNDEDFSIYKKYLESKGF